MSLVGAFCIFPVLTFTVRNRKIIFFSFYSIWIFSISFQFSSTPITIKSSFDTLTAAAGVYIEMRILLAVLRANPPSQQNTTQVFHITSFIIATTLRKYLLPSFVRVNYYNHFSRYLYSSCI